MVNKDLTEFVIEPSNGHWGLSRKEDKDNLRLVLAQKEKPVKCYDGVQLIILNTTNECNLGCIYCNTRGVRARTKMPPEIAIATIDKATKLENIPNIVFHGSEPLLNMQTIEQAVLYGEDISKRIGKQITFNIQTNLTTLNSEKLKFIKEHGIGISTSLDGREEEHNLNRLYLDGRPTYYTLRENMGKILEFQRGISAVCVVTKNNVKNLDKIVLEFEEIGISDIQLLPSVKCPNGSDYRPSNAELTESYIKVFEQTFERVELNTQKSHIRNIAQYLSTLFIRTGIDACRICCSRSSHPLLTVDVNGDIYPCDFFWGDKDKNLGNVKNDSFDSVLTSSKNPRMVSIENTLCGDCKWRNVCGGGCLADKLFSEGKPYYCETHKSVYEYLSKKLPHLLEHNILNKI